MDTSRLDPILSCRGTYLSHPAVCIVVYTCLPIPFLIIGNIWMFFIFRRVSHLNNQLFPIVHSFVPNCKLLKSMKVLSVNSESLSTFLCRREIPYTKNENGWASKIKEKQQRCHYWRSWSFKMSIKETNEMVRMKFIK